MERPSFCAEAMDVGEMVLTICETAVRLPEPERGRLAAWVGTAGGATEFRDVLTFLAAADGEFRTRLIERMRSDLPYPRLLVPRLRV